MDDADVTNALESCSFHARNSTAIGVMDTVHEAPAAPGLPQKMELCAMCYVLGSDRL